MPLGIRPNTQLPITDRECFILWYELGTVTKVIKHLNIAGIINQKTQKPFTSVAISNAAYRFTIFNPDEARGYYEKSIGRELLDQEWEEYLCKKAMTMFPSNSTLKDWIKTHHMEKYQYVWGRRFPNGLE